jgi:drug/metabolite transporter (DMT)-like permease
LPDPAALPWLLGAFASPVLYAFGNAWAEKYRPSGMDSFALAGAMVGAASVGMGVAALATGTFHPIWQEASTVNLVIAGYAALTVVNFFLFFELIRLAGALAVAQVAYIMTLMGLGWGALLFGERPGGWVWLAVALVFAGVALVNFGKREREQ